MTFPHHPSAAARPRGRRIVRVPDALPGLTRYDCYDDAGAWAASAFVRADLAGDDAISALTTETAAAWLDEVLLLHAPAPEAPAPTRRLGFPSLLR